MKSLNHAIQLTKCLNDHRFIIVIRAVKEMTLEKHYQNFNGFLQ